MARSVVLTTEDVRRQQQAAQNNAAWCDAVCRAHGRPGIFHDGIWVNPHDPPRFYPNAVTLTGAEGAAAQTAHIAALVAARAGRECAVKDSFCALDLAPLGFGVLFAAEWIYREAFEAAPDDGTWARITRDADLAAWEAAWDGKGGEPPAKPRVFPPALLTDENIAFLAAYRGGKIVAGCVASWTGAVVGLSNVFLPAGGGEEREAFREACAAQAAAVFPGLPLVGYEAREDLSAFLALGFTSIGPLRVWVRPVG